MPQKDLRKDRDAYFDNAKFFLILLVVLAHSMRIVGGHHISSLFKLIYLFHMPAFVMISGYFSKFQKNPRVAKLFIQYLIFQTVYNIFDAKILNREVILNYTTPNWILWFLLALLVWKSVTPHIVKSRYVIALSIAAAVLAGYDNTISYYLSLSRIIVFYPFFLLGYRFDKSYIYKLKSLLHPALSVAVSVAVFALSYIMLLYLPIFPKDLLFHSFPYQEMGMNEWYAGAFRLLALLWGGILTFCFFNLVPVGHRIYTKLGQRSLQAYILHGFIIKLLSFWKVGSYFSSPFEKLMFFFCMFIITILLLSKPLEYLFNPVTYLSNALKHRTRIRQ